MAMPKIDPSFQPQARPGHVGHPKGYGPKAGEGWNTQATPGGQITPPAADRADISNHARDLVDLRAAVDAGRAELARTADVRPDRLDQVRQRLASGYYQSTEVRQQVAGKLMKVLEEMDRL